MIELIVSDRCTNCGDCVAVCPTNVFDSGQAGTPILARVDDCQTCFMCELHCREDAIYVAPDCDRRVLVTADEVIASGHLGQYRKHSGWHEWAQQFPQRAMADGDSIPAGRRSGGTSQWKAVMAPARVRQHCVREMISFAPTGRVILLLQSVRHL